MDEVTASQAAALTGLSERTIRRKIAAGEIRARHVAPNRYAIKVADLPVHRSPDELIARIEELEHRVRLLELQLRQPRVGSLAPLRNKNSDAGSGSGDAERVGMGGLAPSGPVLGDRSEEHTSELQSPAMISYAVFCLKKQKMYVNI